MGERKRATRRGWLLATPALLLGLALGSACSGNNPQVIETETPEEAATATETAAAAPSATPTIPVVLPEGPSSERIAAANRILREGRFELARATFAQIAEEAANNEERAEAWFGAGSAAHEAGDVEASLAAFRTAFELAPEGTPIASRAGYLLAKRLNDAGEFAEAATVANATERTSVLDGYIRNELARALAGTGDADGANREWDAVLLLPSTSSTARAEIYRARIALAEEADDTDALAAALDGLIAVTGDPEARFERAAIAREAEAWNVFEAQLTAIIEDTPSSSFAVLAIAELREAEIAIDPGTEGLVYYRHDAYADAKRVLTPALDDPAATPSQVTFRAYYLGASYEDSGDYSSAISYYDQAAGTGANSPFIHRAKYWAARSAEAARDYEEASQRYVTLVSDGPAGEFTEESAFRAGYVLLRDSDLDGAIAAWESAGAAESARIAYWRGRALEERGDDAAAGEAFREAIGLGAYDFHGLEAAVRLGLRAPVTDAPYVERDLLQTVDWDAIAVWLRQEVPGDWPGRAPTAACDLMASGLRAQARAELNAASNGSSAWRTLELAREAHVCGVTDVGAQLAVKLRQQAGVASHEPPADLLRVSYPIDFGVTLAEEAKERGIDPLFLAALVRQESFWDPVAGSHAGALGLTQVIPPTGQGIANALGYASFSPSDLFRPAVALEFGAYYLGGQINRFGDPLLALTAYNAGPGNAVRWMERPRDTAADLVESIDITETKLYVTYIYEAYAHYQLAWSRDGAD